MEIRSEVAGSRDRDHRALIFLRSGGRSNRWQIAERGAGEWKVEGEGGKSPSALRMDRQAGEWIPDELIGLFSESIDQTRGNNFDCARKDAF